MSGWIALCQSNISELPFLAKEFQKRYQALLHHPPLNCPHQLTGLMEQQNRLSGFAPPDPVLVEQAIHPLCWRNLMSKISAAGSKKLKKGIPRVFSPTTVARFAEIAEQIQAHENNIAYLQSIATCRAGLRRAGCKKLIKAFQCTPEDERRLPRTLQNLRQQMDLLQYEREVLKRYGR